MPKHSSAKSLNDFRPVALTPIIMKCFERLVLARIKNHLSPSLDPFQFAYRQNRSTEDAISTALHSALSYLDKNNSYVRILFVAFSSTFNTIVPSTLITKLHDLDIDPSLRNWILDFLTNRPPVKINDHTHDCKAIHGSNTIVKFADDTTVVGLISGNNESAYRDEVQRQAVWCADNHLSLNTMKTKETIVDFRKSKGGTHTPLHIDGAEVERVTSFKFLGVHISEDLTWSLNTSSAIKKALQRLFFLRRLKKAHLSPQILTNFYCSTIESILTNCVTVWYGNCSVSDQKALQKVVKTAERIIGSPLPSIESVHKKRCLRKARCIAKDNSHPNHRLFNYLPSGKRYRSLGTRTSRFRRSFFPQAVTLLNSIPKCTLPHPPPPPQPPPVDTAILLNS
uniref:Reverse transcriptase domain-containing protein n=1 Tax=Labrus bergylta TaxID=56723 RepID=A0A3Q3E360_9LABR